MRRGLDHPGTLPSEGYLLDDTVYPVGAEPQRYTAEYNPIALDVTEQVIRGGVNLTKVDKDYPENKLEGAVFEVYRDSNRNQELNDEDELLGTMEDLGGGEYALTGLCYGGYFCKGNQGPGGLLSGRERLLLLPSPRTAKP